MSLLHIFTKNVNYDWQNHLRQFKHVILYRKYQAKNKLSFMVFMCRQTI